MIGEMPNRVKRATETRTKRKTNEEEAKRIAAEIEKTNLTIKQYRKFIQGSKRTLKTSPHRPTTPKPAQDSKTAEEEKDISPRITPDDGLTTIFDGNESAERILEEASAILRKPED